MIIVWIVVLLVGVVVEGVVWGLMARLPKERPNKNWVPTAAEIVGESAKGHPLVRFTPPGREGNSELPAALRQRAKSGRDLLVLLDPLNPVTPYQMDEWNRLKKLVKIVAIVGLVLVVIGLIGLVITIAH